MELLPPKVVRASGACENINTLFEVSSGKNFSWFGSEDRKHQAYLAQTAQLYLEAFVPYLEKVYSVGSSFRAEPGNDSRHLTEFTLIEIEFAGGFEKLLSYIERFIHRVSRDILQLPAKDRILLGLDEKALKRLELVQLPFPRLSYDRAIQCLNLEWGDDISRIKEQELVERLGNQPTFITHYPDPLWDNGKEIEVEKFFNMLPDPMRPGRVLSADLILPIAGEAVGSAARVHNPETLLYRLENSKMFKLLTHSIK